MTLKNSEITSEIDLLSKKMMKLLEHSKALAGSSQQQALVSLKDTINELLQNSYNSQTISLEELNANYRNIMKKKDLKSSYLISPKAIYSEDDKQRLAEAAQFHLKAITHGFEETVKTSTTQTQATPRANVERQFHVHHYHGARDNFWRDMMFYQMIFGNNNRNRGGYYPSQPQAPSQSKTDTEKQKEVSWAGILIATSLIVGALATIGYTVAQTYYRMEEMVHGEDITGNAAKLSITALAALQGYMVGAILGAIFFSNPILAAVCTTILAASAGMAASKWGIEKIHQLLNNESALATDPRYYLTEKQKNNLIEKKINPDVVNEALRECAININDEPTNGLIFWQNPNADMIALVRNLKSGNVPEKLQIDITRDLEDGKKVTITKEFDLHKPYAPSLKQNVTPSAPPAETDETLDKDRYLAPSTPQSFAPVMVAHAVYV